MVNRKLGFIVYPKSANVTWRCGSGKSGGGKEGFSEISINGSVGVIQSPNVGAQGPGDGFFDEFGFVNV